MARTKTDWATVRLLQQNTNQINCEEHFTLTENAKIELAKMRRTRHAVYNIN